MRPQLMLPEDFDAVRAPSKSLGRNSRPELFGNNECQLVLKNATGQLVGWARAAWWDPQDQAVPCGYYLSGVEISRQYQRQGFAAILSRARLRWISERAKEAWCVVNARNEASIALQLSLGFDHMFGAARIGNIEFTGGEGLLLRKDLSQHEIAGVEPNEEGKQ